MHGLIIKITSFCNNLKIRKKLLVIYFIASVVPMLCIGLFLILSTRNLVLQQHNTQLEAENKRVKLILFDVTYLAANTSQLIFYDRQLRDIISTIYDNEAEIYKAYRDYPILDNYLNNYTELSGITLYVNNKTMVSAGRFKVVDDNDQNSEWYKLASGSSGEILWLVGSDPKKDGYLHLVRKIPLSGPGDYAVMMIRISNNFLKLMVSDSPLQTKATLNYNQVFYSNDYNEILKPLQIQKDKNNPERWQTGFIKYNSQDVLAFESVLKPVNTDSLIEIVTIDKDAAGNIDNITCSITVIVTISLVVPYLVIFLFSNFFSRRINTLRKEMHKIAGGNLNIIDNFNGNDEMGDLFTDMKLTIKDINKLNMEIYNEKLAREKLINIQQKMEYEMLCSQINPHFLYNTLETVRMKAFNSGANEIAHIIKLLGKSMRHVLEVSNGLVTLGSELNYIKIYMDIQLFRFGDKIRYKINVAYDINVEEYMILPLLLQPVIENSFVHGFEDIDSDGLIAVNIEKDCDKIVIAVSDNGSGIRQDTYHSLVENLGDAKNIKSGKSIGLNNIQQRIKLFYGSDYGLEIKSVQGKGTVVIICLPLDWRSVNDLEGTVG